MPWSIAGDDVDICKVGDWPSLDLLLYTLGIPFKPRYNHSLEEEYSQEKENG